MKNLKRQLAWPNQMEIPCNFCRQLKVDQIKYKKLLRKYYILCYLIPAQLMQQS